MPQITSGRVVYSRTKQPAQYESQRAEVELTFVLAEGEELGGAVVEYIEMAKAEVHAALGIRTVPVQR